MNLYSLLTKLKRLNIILYTIVDLSLNLKVILIKFIYFNNDLLTFK